MIRGGQGLASQTGQQISRASPGPWTRVCGVNQWNEAGRNFVDGVGSRV